MKDLGFHYLLSTDLEVGEDGLLTGKPKGLVCVGKNKKRLTLNLAKQVGIDIEKSYAYVNDQADIPLLEIVGNPYVVEPTAPLEIVARQRSWPILSFRATPCGLPHTIRQGTSPCPTIHKPMTHTGE